MQNKLWKGSFGNTAVKVWKQQTRFYWVCSWEISHSPGLSANVSLKSRYYNCFSLYRNRHVLSWKHYCRERVALNWPFALHSSWWDVSSFGINTRGKRIKPIKMIFLMIQIVKKRQAGAELPCLFYNIVKTYINNVMTKRVFGSLKPGKTQTSKTS